MKASTKAKWIVGLTGTAFSAFIISNLDQTNSTFTDSNGNILAAEITNSMSDREKELIQLDWSDFSIQVNNNKESTYDRTTRRTR